MILVITSLSLRSNHCLRSGRCARAHQHDRFLFVSMNLGVVKGEIWNSKNSIMSKELKKIKLVSSTELLFLQLLLQWDSKSVQVKLAQNHAVLKIPLYQYFSLPLQKQILRY